MWTLSSWTVRSLALPSPSGAQWNVSYEPRYIEPLNRNPYCLLSEARTMMKAPTSSVSFLGTLVSHRRSWTGTATSLSPPQPAAASEVTRTVSRQEVA